MTSTVSVRPRNNCEFISMFVPFPPPASPTPHGDAEACFMSLFRLHSPWFCQIQSGPRTTRTPGAIILVAKIPLWLSPSRFTTLCSLYNFFFCFNLPLLYFLFQHRFSVYLRKQFTLSDDPHSQKQRKKRSLHQQQQHMCRGWNRVLNFKSDFSLSPPFISSTCDLSCWGICFLSSLTRRTHSLARTMAKPSSLKMLLCCVISLWWSI